ncbi:hypothetical protein BJX66DRAFT_344594 [Aspergillus keveii]|uniref:Uncharacterized protein n=1 Tax=Aspergillus keveii TaxID=714993 RepID=A0ABR4FKQ4_9EURO
MIDLGLFHLQPGLSDEEQWRCWPKRVVDYPAEISDAALHKFKTHTERLADVEQFRALLEFINRSYGLSEYDTVVDGVKDLSVSEHSGRYHPSLHEYTA